MCILFGAVEQWKSFGFVYNYVQTERRQPVLIFSPIWLLLCHKLAFITNTSHSHPTHHFLTEFFLNSNEELIVSTPMEQRTSSGFAFNDGNWHRVEWSSQSMWVLINSSFSTQMVIKDGYTSWYDDENVVISLETKTTNVGEFQVN